MRSVGGLEGHFHRSHSMRSDKDKKKKKKKKNKSSTTPASSGANSSVASDASNTQEGSTDVTTTSNHKKKATTNNIPSLLPPTEMFQKIADGVAHLPKNTVEAGKKVSHGIQKKGEAMLVKPVKEAVSSLSSHGSGSHHGGENNKNSQTTTTIEASDATTAAVMEESSSSKPKPSSTVSKVSSSSSSSLSEKNDSTTQENNNKSINLDDDDDVKLAIEDEQQEASLREFNESIRDAFFAKPMTITDFGKRVKKDLKKTGQTLFVKPTKAIAKQLHAVGHTTSSTSSSDKQDEKQVGDVEDVGGGGGPVVPALPPDEKLKEMDLIYQKRIKGITIKEYFDLVWSEGRSDGTTKTTTMKPLFAPWLEESGKRDIHVSDWEIAPEEEGKEFIGEWCGEKYNKKRTVTFEFVRTTHLYTGPPVAKVKQTHHCWLDSNNDRCIIEITIEMNGIPFADCFHVEVRWVATQMKQSNNNNKDHGIQIEIGLHVNFLKSTMLASKIRAGTTEETTKSQISLFDAAKQACVTYTGAVDEEDDEEQLNGEGGVKARGLDDDNNDDSKQVFTCGPFAGLFELFGQNLKKRRNDDITMSVEQAHYKLKQIDSLLQQQQEGTTTPEQKFEMRTELNNIHMSLDKLINQVQQQQQ